MLLFPQLKILFWLLHALKFGRQSEELLPHSGLRRGLRGRVRLGRQLGCAPVWSRSLAPGVLREADLVTDGSGHPLPSDGGLAPFLVSGAFQPAGLDTGRAGACQAGTLYGYCMYPFTSSCWPPSLHQAESSLSQGPGLSHSRLCILSA